MATMKLIPSSYLLSNSSYLTISNANNMYTDTASTTYATINHNRSSKTAYYVYIRGFNFNDIPADAIITSAIIKVKARVANASTNQKPALYNNTTAIAAAPTFGTAIGSSDTISTADITNTLNTYKTYGNNFGIRLSLNRTSTYTASNMRIYGAEIEITYTVPSPTNDTRVGNLTPSKYYIGINEVSKIYQGNTLIYEGGN